MTAKASDDNKAIDESKASYYNKASDHSKVSHYRMASTNILYMHSIPIITISLCIW